MLSSFQISIAMFLPFLVPFLINFDEQEEVDFNINTTLIHSDDVTDGRQQLLPSNDKQKNVVTETDQRHSLNNNRSSYTLNSSHQEPKSTSSSSNSTHRKTMKLKLILFFMSPIVKFWYNLVSISQKPYVYYWCRGNHWLNCWISRYETWC